jgi:hypothetical protein
MQQANPGPGAGMERLKLLMTYTIFHIGLYATLSGVLLTLLGSSNPLLMRSAIAIALACFVLAGVCGGLVASHIPHVNDFDEFYDGTWLGPWGLTVIKASLCMRLEHIFFWLGVAVALWGLRAIIA